MIMPNLIASQNFGLSVQGQITTPSDWSGGKFGLYSVIGSTVAAVAEYVFTAPTTHNITINALVTLDPKKRYFFAVKTANATFVGAFSVSVSFLIGLALVDPQSNYGKAVSPALVGDSPAVECASAYNDAEGRAALLSMLEDMPSGKMVFSLYPDEEEKKEESSQPDLQRRLEMLEKLYSLQQSLIMATPAPRHRDGDADSWQQPDAASPD